jgi:lipopolysaccharide transport system ATP-binding protein
MASISIQKVGVHFLIPAARSLNIGGAISRIALGGQIGGGQGGIGVSALKDISLELNDGDRLGILGHNGAGKSTLLRVLGGILPPTSGYVRVEGVVSALLSIHMGLRPESSGQDNIRFRARYMGCSEDDIANNFKDIVEFSGLGEYLQLPLKSYSSGMKLRLAFAIATAFKPDILILDEWLSAGDAEFQKKASERLRNLIDKSGIFAFASHNYRLQAELCNRGIVLSRGEIVFAGSIDEAIEYNQRIQAAKSVCTP